MNATFVNVSTIEMMVKTKLCPALDLTFDARAEHPEWDKYGAGCEFITHDMNGRKFKINANCHLYSKKGVPMWVNGGKKWNMKNVQMPKPAYQDGCMLQIIVNADCSSCVVAERKDMYEDDWGSMRSYKFDEIDINARLKKK